MSGGTFTVTDDRIAYQKSITFGSNPEFKAQWPFADQDGWLLVQSNDATLLEDLLDGMFINPLRPGHATRMYAFDYDGPEPSSAHLYSKGVLATITVIIEEAL